MVLAGIPPKFQRLNGLDIKIRETKELACARSLKIVFRHCARDHDQWLGLWMARLDVTEIKNNYGKVRRPRVC